jgi:hypothetical protein
VTLKAITLWQPWASLCVLAQNRPHEERHRVEGGAVSCGYCNRTFTFNFMRDQGPHQCTCRSAAAARAAARQPFKTIETRSWRAPKWLIGKRIAIHAATRTNGWGRRGTRTQIGAFEVERDASGLLLRGPIAWPYRLPLGSVVGTAVLAGCVPIHDQWCRCPARTSTYMSIGVGGLGREILGLYREDGLAYSRTNGNLDRHPWTVGRDDEDIIAQIPYGHYACGRWAWLLSDAKNCAPVAAVGKPGSWDWSEAPDLDQGQVT